jgi:hypothetical protein
MSLVSATLWPALLSALLRNGALSQKEFRGLVETALLSLDQVDDLSSDVVESARATIEEFYALAVVQPPDTR